MTDFFQHFRILKLFYTLFYNSKLFQTFSKISKFEKILVLSIFQIFKYSIIKKFVHSELYKSLLEFQRNFKVRQFERSRISKSQKLVINLRTNPLLNQIEEHSYSNFPNSRYTLMAAFI